MALLTGAAIRIGTTGGFGQSEARPRGITGFMDQNLYVVGASQRRLIRITDLENATGEYASAQLPNPVHSLSEFDGNIYFTVHEVLHRVSPPFTATTTHTELGVIATGVSVRTLETDGTNLWGYDKNDNKIYQITPAASSVSATEWATVTFPSSVTNPNVDGLLFFNGRWYVLERGTDALYILPETITEGSTIQATRVGSETNFGASVEATLGAGHFDGKAYLVDDDVNGLFRLIETINFENASIADQTFEVGTAVDVTLPEAEDGTGTYTYAITPALPAGVTFNPSTRKLTGNPTAAVAETDYTYTATDSGDNKTATLEFKITVSAVAPVWLPDVQLVGSVTAGQASRTFNIASLVGDATSITDVSGVPSWGSFDGTDLVLTNIPDTDTVQTITIRFDATNDAGTTPADFILTWNPLEVVWDANLTRTIGPNVTTAINIAALARNADTVETTSTLESWMSFDGTELEITDSPELTTDTDYTIAFRARRGGQSWVTANYVLTVREAMLPTWVIAAQRVGTVTAADVRRVFNIADLVADETAITEVSGVPSWGAFDGTELVLEDVPETDTVETITITFRATNGDGLRDATFVLTWNPLLVAWVHASRLMASLSGGKSTNVDIRDLVANADTIEVVSGLENFMNFFGRVLEIRNAPRVMEDTAYTIRFRARRGGREWVEADFIVTVTVAVTFAPKEELRKTIASGVTLDIAFTEIVEYQDELEVVSGLENWMSFDEGILRITHAPIVTESVIFIIRLRARRDMGDWIEADYELTLRPSTLLPPNSTQLERDFEAALLRREVILFDGASRDPRDSNVPARNIWDPDKVASPLLPYLANAMSVDVWDDAWNEAVKRQVIKDSYLVHSKKGTVQSIRDLLSSLGFRIAVINEGDANSWANYSVTLNYTITIAQGQAIIRALEAVAPIRSTLTGLYVQSNTHLWDGSIRFDGSFSFGQIIQLI